MTGVIKIEVHANMKYIIFAFKEQNVKQMPVTSSFVSVSYDDYH